MYDTIHQSMQRASCRPVLLTVFFREPQVLALRVAAKLAMLVIIKTCIAQLIWLVHHRVVLTVLVRLLCIED